MYIFLYQVSNVNTHTYNPLVGKNVQLPVLFKFCCEYVQGNHNILHFYLNLCKSEEGSAYIQWQYITPCMY